MWRYTIPNEILEQLRCSLCKEYLSHLPIYSYPDQEGVACGRCPVLSDQHPLRNLSYEAIAKYLYFPCRYKPHGCIENILSIHMQEHEESCRYKQYFCPFVPLASCHWQGAASELFEHYRLEHCILALSSPTVELDLQNTFEDNYLLAYIGELFLIHVKRDTVENMLWFGVRFIGDHKKGQGYMFKMDAMNPDGNRVTSSLKSPVDSDANMNLNKVTAVNISIEQIQAILDDSQTVSINIDISYSRKNIENGLQSGKLVNKVVDENFDENILRELECPVCNEHMIPPIHQCIAGHSICDTCKTQVRECPTCRNKIQDTRNYTLEKMTNLINYHCKFRDFGCTYVSKSDKIKIHESECKCGPFDCPFNEFFRCKWIGKLSEVMNHIWKEHEENVLEIDVITWPFQEEFSDEVDTDCFIIKHKEDVFKLLFKYEEGMFSWSMQLVGAVEEASNYMFELDFIDTSGSEQRFFIRRNCSRCKADCDAFELAAEFVEIPYYLLSPFMNGSDLIYKCRVIEKTVNSG